jgi:hypothetical protein
MPITSYLVKDGANNHVFDGTTGKSRALNFTSRNPNPTLWQVESESETEAAVRRMNWLKSQCKDKPSSYIFVIMKGEVEETIDAHCPQPAPKETQLEWKTGEPIRKVHCWQIPSGLWVASYHTLEQQASNGDNSNFALLVNGLSAIGISEELARLNLSNAKVALKLKS